MQLGQGCRTRTPRWCWLLMGAAACLVLPGAALVGTAEEKPAASLGQNQARPGAAGTATVAQGASRKHDSPHDGDRRSAPQEIVTVRVANDPGSLRAGETIDLILAIDISQTPKAKPDPRVILKGVDSAVTPPTFETIVRALPDAPKGNFPFLAEAKQKISQITVELIVNGLGEIRFYPMVGQARHLRQQFKCTVEIDKEVQSDWPIPFTHSDQIQEVVYIDLSQLICADRVQEAIYIDKSVAGKGKGNLLDGTTETEESDSYEIRVAVATAPAKILKTALPKFLPVVFRRDPDDRKSPRDRSSTQPAPAGQVSNLSGQLKPPADKPDVAAVEKSNPERASAKRDDVAATAKSIDYQNIFAAAAADPNGGQRLKLYIALHTDAATQRIDQALHAEAGTVGAVEGFKPTRLPSDKTPSEKFYRLQNNVVLWLQDGSMKASADRAIVVPKYQTASKELIDQLGITLYDNARWSSGNLEASARELTVTMRTAFAGDASSPRVSELTLRGAARFVGENFVGMADGIQVHFGREEKGVGQRPLKVVLEGDVALSETNGAAIGAGRRIQRIECVARLGGERSPYSFHVGNMIVKSITIKHEPGGMVTTEEWASPALSKTKAGERTEPATGKDRRSKYMSANKPGPDDLVTLTYSVADLVVTVEHMSVTMAEDGSVTDSKAGQTAAASAGPQASFTELMELILATVAPDTWENQSGPGSMIPYRTTLSLVVRQTQAVHEQIAELLGQLRRLQDLQCTFQVDVISTSGGPSKEQLRFESDSAASGDEATYLTEAQLKTFREMIAEMEQADRAAITGRLKLNLFNGQGAELKLRRRRLPVKETVPLPEISVVPIIAADRTAIRLQLAVGASKALDALARTQGYTIKKGQTLLLDLTDAQLRNNLARLVGAQSGAVRRLHKLDLFAGDEPGALGHPDKAALRERVLLLITPQIVEVEEKEELLGVDLPAKSALSAIVIEGNKTIETRVIMNLIKTQTGQPLDPKQVKDDVRALVAQRWFFSVELRVIESSAGPVLIFRVSEKPNQDKAP